MPDRPRHRLAPQLSPRAEDEWEKGEESEHRAKIGVSIGYYPIYVLFNLPRVTDSLCNASLLRGTFITIYRRGISEV